MVGLIWPMIEISGSDRLNAVKHYRKFKVVVCVTNTRTKVNDVVLNKTAFFQFKIEFGVN
jgi:hypothetical protein